MPHFTEECWITNMQPKFSKTSSAMVERCVQWPLPRSPFECSVATWYSGRFPVWPPLLPVGEAGRGAARFVLTSPQICCRGRLTGGRAGGPGSRGTRREAPKTRKIRCQGFLFILILKTFPPELTLILGNSSTEILTSVHPWDSPQRQDVSGPLPAWPQHRVNTCHASISLLTPRLGLSRQVLPCGHALCREQGGIGWVTVMCRLGWKRLSSFQGGCPRAFPRSSGLQANVGPEPRRSHGLCLLRCWAPLCALIFIFVMNFCPFKKLSCWHSPY